MNRKAYNGDLADAEWALLASFIPPALPGGRPRKHDIREVLDAIFYINRGGCAWRLLPDEFPPWQTVKQPRRWFRVPEGEEVPFVPDLVALPRRWVVERTFAWIGRYRRMSKDYEYLTETGEAFIYAATPASRATGHTRRAVRCKLRARAAMFRRW